MFGKTGFFTEGDPVTFGDLLYVFTFAVPASLYDGCRERISGLLLISATESGVSRDRSILSNVENLVGSEQMIICVRPSR
jgi:hypothetical protein